MNLPAAALGLVGAGAVVLGLAIACTPLGGVDGGTTPCAAPPAADSCVLPAVARDNASGMAWPATLADVSARCGATQADVATMWSAHTQAEAIEGFVPKAPPTGSDR